MLHGTMRVTAIVSCSFVLPAAHANDVQSYLCVARLVLLVHAGLRGCRQVLARAAGHRQ